MDKEEKVIKELHLVDAFSSNDFPSIVTHLTTHLSTKGAIFGGYGSPLHLAISLSSKHTIEQLIEYWQKDVLEWVNMQNAPSLETPLHLVAKQGRVELIDVVFKIKTVNDTIRDNLGRVAFQVAKNEKVADLIKRLPLLTTQLRNSISLAMSSNSSRAQCMIRRVEKLLLLTLLSTKEPAST